MSESDERAAAEAAAARSGRGGGMGRRAWIGLLAGASVLSGALAAALLWRRRSTELPRRPERGVRLRAHCVACLGCVALCPSRALVVRDGPRVAVRAERCIHCGACVAACPVDAVLMARLPADAGGG